MGKSNPLKRRSMPLYARVLFGVGAGVFLGEAFANQPYPLLGIRNEDLGQLGLLVIRLLKALAVPLVLFAILDAFVKTRITAKAGGKLVLICLVNVSVAMTIGLTLVNLFQPGKSWEGQLGTLSSRVGAKKVEAADVKDPVALVTGKAAPKDAGSPTLDPLKNVAGYVPESLLDPFLKNNIITVVLLGIFAGAALRRVRDFRQGAPDPGLDTLERFVSAGYEVLILMLGWVVLAVPFAVMCVVAQVVGKHGFEVFKILWAFLAICLGGLAIHSLLYYPLAAWIAGKTSPRVYLGQGVDAIVTGLTTNSSLATVPVTLRVLTERMGISHRSARLAACVGTNLNNDGITLYEAIAALFLAQAVGLHLGIGEQITVVLASIMAGVGVAGIPEAGLIVLPLVLGAAGLSETTIAVAIPLILPVDWIIARCRSGVNVMSDMLVAILLDRAGKPLQEESEVSASGAE